MPPQRKLSRVDTLGIKSQIFKKLGRQKAEKYFFNLRRLLNLKLGKTEFDKFCYSIMGKENIRLHNFFIRSIISNACFSNGPPSRQAATGHSQNTKTSSGQFSEILQASPQRGTRSFTSRDLRPSERPSPLGLHGKVTSGSVTEVTNSYDIQRSREQQSAPELISIGSKALVEVASVEDGEEVEQERGSPIIQSRSPIRAPYGIVLNTGGLNRGALPGVYSSTSHLTKSEVSECSSINSMLPDTPSLRKRLELRMETEGLSLSVDSINLLNYGLDAYLKRMIKPCLELARSRCGNNILSETSGNFQHGINGSWHAEELRRSSQCYSTSTIDFKMAMQLNPHLLGVHWPVLLEKICLYPSIE